MSPYRYFDRVVERIEDYVKTNEWWENNWKITMFATVLISTVIPGGVVAWTTAINYTKPTPPTVVEKIVEKKVEVPAPPTSPAKVAETAPTAIPLTISLAVAGQDSASKK